VAAGFKLGFAEIGMDPGRMLVPAATTTEVFPMKYRLITAALLPFAVGGCAMPTEPSAGTLELTTGGAVIETLGVAYVPFAGAARATVRLVSEDRWTGDTPVLDARDLRAGMLRARAPGVATLEVRGGGALFEAKVYVQLDSPLVLSWEQDGDVLRLRGYRLDLLRGAEVGGSSAEILHQDSAAAQLRLPPTTAVSCGGAGSQGVRLLGASALDSIVVRRRRAGDLHLAVGQSVLLDDAAAACLRLAPIDGARYALAFFDSRRLERSMTGPEEVQEASEDVRAWVLDRSVGPGPMLAAGSAPHRLPAVQPDGHLNPCAAAPCPAAGTSSWQHGAAFELGGKAAQVLAIRGDYIVLAAFTEALPYITPEWRAGMIQAVDAAIESALPLLQFVLDPRLAHTDGTGKLLVVVGRNFGYNGAAINTFSSRGVSTTIVIDHAEMAQSIPSLLGLLSHELTHAWQALYRSAAGGQVIHGSLWASEGGADLVASEVERRRGGIGLGDNLEWRNSLPSSVGHRLLREPRRVSGNIATGYGDASSLMRDIVIRRTESGEALDDALSAVLRGSLEGWHGIDGRGNPRTGLTARMRERVPDWEARQAVLTWVLSHAVDDVIPHPVFRNNTFARAGEAPALWGRSGLAGGTGAMSASWQRHGGAGYFLIDDSIGGTYTLGVDGAPRLSWKIVRYQ
jgi:hypothetical protein